MYKNLEAEMVRRGVSRMDLAKMIDKRYQAICLKLNGKSVFTYDEAKAIKDTLFPDCDIEFLFARTNPPYPHNTTQPATKMG